MIEKWFSDAWWSPKTFGTHCDLGLQFLFLRFVVQFGVGWFISWAFLERSIWILGAIVFVVRCRVEIVLQIVWHAEVREGFCGAEKVFKSAAVGWPPFSSV